MQRIFLITLSIGALYLLFACKKKSDYNTMYSPVVVASYKTYLALGDSYTIGQSVAEPERFPVQAEKLLQKDSINFNAPEYIAVTGWTTRNLIDAINNTPPQRSTYDFVTLLIGVNNQFQGRSQAEYSTEFTALLSTAIKFAGNRPSRVAVLSIPDWSVTPFAAGYDRALIGRQIDSFNVINKQISLSKNVNYIDITPTSRLATTDASLIAGDGLHPSGKQYALWATPLAAIIKASL